MRRLLLPLCVVLGACMPVAPNDTVSRAAPASDAALPPIKSFARAQPKPPLAANSDIARDFLDLAFTLESGRRLPFFSRFEGPVSLRVTGAAPAHLGADLDAVLHRLRTEAGIAIARTDAEKMPISPFRRSAAPRYKKLAASRLFCGAKHQQPFRIRRRKAHPTLRLGAHNPAPKAGNFSAQRYQPARGARLPARGIGAGAWPLERPLSPV